MGKATTTAKNKWNAQAYDQLRVLVKKGQKDKIADRGACIPM